MQFPYYFHLFGHTIHPHPVMEGLAYAVALITMFSIRKKRHELATQKSLTHTLWLTAAAAIGALLGAKLLAWVEGPAQPTMDNFLTGGKTIVGGISGAWLATELAKKILHIRERTGDPWVYPLTISIAIGRIGCFLTGLSDNTYGNYSSLPWAVDFGDGPRHPTQLYESAFALLLFLAFLLTRNRPAQPGTRFRLFILSYMLFRFLIEFIKPTNKPYLGLSAIQLTTLLTALCATWQLRPVLVPGSPKWIAAQQKEILRYSLQEKLRRESPGESNRRIWPILYYMVGAAVTATVGTLIFLNPFPLQIGLRPEIGPIVGALFVGLLMAIISGGVLVIAISIRAPFRQPRPRFTVPIVTGAVFGTTPFIATLIVQKLGANDDWLIGAWLTLAILYVVAISYLLTERYEIN